MKIAIEKRIPYLSDALTGHDDLILLEANEFDREVLLEVDIMIIRTTVKCNSELLEGTSVRYILTATIGYDHIDTDYCKRRGIEWRNAPGCNADAVAQYFVSALMVLKREHLDVLSDMTVGIIGYGHVGKRIAKACSTFGMNILINDPPLQLSGGCSEAVDWCSLDDIAGQADIITVHTPFTKGGDHPTFQLLSATFFDRCTKRPIIMNAARGGIVDEVALLKAHDRNQVGEIVVDCWDNEPEINRSLLAVSSIHTPHIAGYSAEGKANATRICLQHLQDLGYRSINMDQIKLPKPAHPFIQFSEDNYQVDCQKALLHAYDIMKDSNSLKADPSSFRQLRDHYSYRREAGAYTIVGCKASSVDLLSKLGFGIEYPFS